ncbi:hypothetical protein [Mucilaginibacter pedocola]|nr:hypothetical protein [Mucilaginibacter pedocola]
MISINLSMGQLIEAVQALNPVEKEQLKAVLNGEDDLYLSDEQKQIVLSRQQAYNSGNMEAYSLDELKIFLKYTED